MFSSLKDKLSLQDGTQIPIFGFGCWGATGDAISNAVTCALSYGYRYIDSAARYLNESDVGKGLSNSSLPREDYYLLSKLWPAAFDCAEKALEQSLRDLKVSYLDAYLLHWPGTDSSRRLRATEAILKCHEVQMIKTVGVSNYQIPHLLEFKQHFGFFPAVNQVELHPFYQERELVDFCRANDIRLIAWGPLYRARGMEHEALTALCQGKGKTPAQILLRWHLQKGYIAIPKSEKPERILENAAIFDFCLNDSEMDQLDALDCGLHIGADPFTYNGEIKK